MKFRRLIALLILPGLLLGQFQYASAAPAPVSHSLRLTFSNQALVALSTQFRRAPAPNSIVPEISQREGILARLHAVPTPVWAMASVQLFVAGYLVKMWLFPKSADDLLVLKGMATMIFMPARATFLLPTTGSTGDLALHAETINGHLGQLWHQLNNASMVVQDIHDSTNTPPELQLLKAHFEQITEELKSIDQETNPEHVPDAALSPLIREKRMPRIMEFMVAWNSHLNEMQDLVHTLSESPAFSSQEIELIAGSVEMASARMDRILGIRHPSAINLNSVLRDAIAHCNLGTEVGQTYATEVPATYADAYEVDEVFEIILKNASHAMKAKPGSTLRVETRWMKETDMVQVRIIDTGTGIKPEILSRIFDDRYTTKAPDKGTGHGLDISVKIMKNLGGTLYVESEVGKGTTFTLEFPALVDSPLFHEPKAQEPTVTPRVQVKPRLLVVEDEARLVQIAKRNLEPAGFEVVAAAQGDRAIELFKAGGFDVVIVDNNLPAGPQGKDVIAEILKIDPNITIFFATGEKQSHNFQISGITIPVIYKPFIYPALIPRLKTPPVITSVVNSEPAKIKILVVEDEKNVGPMVKQHLEMQGFEIVLVETGQEALSAFRQGGFSAAILDNGLKDHSLDGRAVAKGLLAIDPTVKVIFTTGSPFLKEDLQKAGLEMEVMVKPYTMAALSDWAKVHAQSKSAMPTEPKPASHLFPEISVGAVIASAFLMWIIDASLGGGAGVHQQAAFSGFFLSHLLLKMWRAAKSGPIAPFLRSA